MNEDDFLRENMPKMLSGKLNMVTLDEIIAENKRLKELVTPDGYNLAFMLAQAQAENEKLRAFVMKQRDNAPFSEHPYLLDLYKEAVRLLAELDADKTKG